MSRSKSLNFDFYLLLKRMLNEQLTSYFPSEYFIMIALIIGLGFFSDGKKKKCRRVLFYSVKCRKLHFRERKNEKCCGCEKYRRNFFPFLVLSEFYLILYSAVAPITL